MYIRSDALHGSVAVLEYPLPRIDTASLVDQCGELMSSAQRHLTQAVQLAYTTAMEKHVAAELHYALAWQGHAQPCGVVQSTALPSAP